MSQWVYTDGGRKSWILNGASPADVRTRASDCLTRALASMVGKFSYSIFWNEVTHFKQELSRPNRKNADYGANIRHGQMVIEALGLGTMRIEKLAKRRKLSKWIEEHPGFIGFVRVGNHFVAIRDGKFYDTFDCSNTQVTHIAEWVK